MMPGLPGSNPELGPRGHAEVIRRHLISSRHDEIYPTLVVRETALARAAEAGLYRPYGLDEVVDLLAEMKRYVPRWHRIMRIMREIPETDIRGGPNAGNLRELVLRRVKELGYECNCIQVQGGRAGLAARRGEHRARASNRGVRGFGRGGGLLLLRATRSPEPSLASSG